MVTAQALLPLVLLASSPLSAQQSALSDSADARSALEWAALIDSAAARKAMATTRFAHSDSGLSTVHDSTDWPENADSEIAVYVDQDRRPLRLLIWPMSRSGDWSVTWAYYFDTDGSTRVFIARLSYFRDECGGVVTEERRTVYRPDFTVIHSTRHRFDRTGAAREAPECGHPYTWAVGDPRPRYADFEDSGLAPPH